MARGRFTSGEDLSQLLYLEYIPAEEILFKNVRTSFNIEAKLLSWLIEKLFNKITWKKENTEVEKFAVLTECFKLVKATEDFEELQKDLRELVDIEILLRPLHHNAQS